MRTPTKAKNISVLYNDRAVRSMGHGDGGGGKYAPPAAAKAEGARSQRGGLRRNRSSRSPATAASDVAIAPVAGALGLRRLDEADEVGNDGADGKSLSYSGDEGKTNSEGGQDESYENPDGADSGSSSSSSSSSNSSSSSSHSTDSGVETRESGDDRGCGGDGLGAEGSSAENPEHLLESEEATAVKSPTEGEVEIETAMADDREAAGEGGGAAATSADQHGDASGGGSIMQRGEEGGGEGEGDIEAAAAAGKGENGEGEGGGGNGAAREEGPEGGVAKEGGTPAETEEEQEEVQQHGEDKYDEQQQQQQGEGGEATGDEETQGGGSQEEVGVTEGSTESQEQGDQIGDGGQEVGSAVGHEASSSSLGPGAGVIATKDGEHGGEGKKPEGDRGKVPLVEQFTTMLPLRSSAGSDGVPGVGREDSPEEMVGEQQPQQQQQEQEEQQEEDGWEEGGGVHEGGEVGQEGSGVDFGNATKPVSPEVPPLGTSAMSPLNEPQEAIAESWGSGDVGGGEAGAGEEKTGDEELEKSEGEGEGEGDEHGHENSGGYLGDPTNLQDEPQEEASAEAGDAESGAGGGGGDGDGGGDGWASGDEWKGAAQQGSAVSLEGADEVTAAAVGAAEMGDEHGGVEVPSESFSTPGADGHGGGVDGDRADAEVPQEGGEASQGGVDGNPGEPPVDGGHSTTAGESVDAEASQGGGDGSPGELSVEDGDSTTAGEGAIAVAPGEGGGQAGAAQESEEANESGGDGNASAPQVQGGNNTTGGLGAEVQQVEVGDAEVPHESEEVSQGGGWDWGVPPEESGNSTIAGWGADALDKGKEGGDAAVPHVSEEMGQGGGWDWGAPPAVGGYNTTAGEDADALQLTEGGIDAEIPHVSGEVGEDGGWGWGLPPVGGGGTSGVSGFEPKGSQGNSTSTGGDRLYPMEERIGADVPQEGGEASGGGGLGWGDGALPAPASGAEDAPAHGAGDIPERVANGMASEAALAPQIGDGAQMLQGEEGGGGGGGGWEWNGAAYDERLGEGSPTDAARPGEAVADAGEQGGSTGRDWPASDEPEGGDGAGGDVSNPGGGGDGEEQGRDEPGTAGTYADGEHGGDLAAGDDQGSEEKDAPQKGGALALTGGIPEGNAPDEPDGEGALVEVERPGEAASVAGDEQGGLNRGSSGRSSGGGESASGGGGGGRGFDVTNEGNEGHRPAGGIAAEDQEGAAVAAEYSGTAGWDWASNEHEGDNGDGGGDGGWDLPDQPVPSSGSVPAQGAGESTDGGQDGDESRPEEGVGGSQAEVLPGSGAFGDRFEEKTSQELVEVPVPQGANGGDEGGEHFGGDPAGAPLFQHPADEGDGSGSVPENQADNNNINNNNANHDGHQKCVSDRDCEGDNRTCLGGMCECDFPWSGDSCEDEACRIAMSCKECRSFDGRAPALAQYGCVWDEEAGVCHAVFPRPSSAEAFGACPAEATPAAAAAAAGAGAAVPPPPLDDPQHATPPQLWYVAGLPLLVIALCGGLVVFGARCMRKWYRADAEGPSYTPVDTANAAESSGGEGWGWEGEDDDQDGDGGDVEMPLAPASALASSSSLSRQAAKAGAGAGAATAAGVSGRAASSSGKGLGGGFREQPAIPIVPGSSAATSGASIDSSARPEGSGGSGGAARPSRARAGRADGGLGGRSGRRRKTGGAGGGGQTGILADDDLFAELGIEAKPTFRGKKSPPRKPAARADRSLAMQEPEDSGVGAGTSWVDDDDLDDLLK